MGRPLSQDEVREIEANVDFLVGIVAEWIYNTGTDTSYYTKSNKEVLFSE